MQASGHGRPPPVHGGGLLPLRRRRRAAGRLPGGARAPTPAGLRVPCHRLGPRRGGALLVAAGLGPAIEHALISVLALNGLRVSEATGANIEALGLERDTAL